MSDDLVKRLRYGLIEYPKRWSGDTHSDMGGSVDYDKTYALLDEAANRIEALEAKLAKAHLALNYFLMRDPDKPTYWEYRRDRAEELARDVLETTQELTGGKDD